MNRQGLVLAAACALISLPFLVVDIPPITDLPQQSAQIRLLIDHGANDAYRVQLWHPNKLGYLPIAIGWQLGGPLAAGRLGLMLIGIVWMLSLHVLARCTERPPLAALLAGLFFFNHLTYWGFLNFLTGLPIFVLWWLLLDRQQRSTNAVHGLVLTAGAWLLYSAHILWLAFGLVWLVIRALMARASARDVMKDVLWTSPVLAMVALWYPSLSRGGFESQTVWGDWHQRLHPSWTLNSAFGGLHSPIELGLFLLIAGLALLGLVQHRTNIRTAIHPLLLATAALAGGGALLLPGVTQHTIFFASRWVPITLVFLVLGMPLPRLRPVLGTSLGILVLAAWTSTTALTWLSFERDELAGLQEILEDLPESPKVLGLDFGRQSERIQGYPFYHLYAYAQVLRGGALNRSFANEASSLVVYSDLPRQLPWTEGLDWDAKRLRRSDIPHFDHVIVHGPPEVQAFFDADPRLEAASPARPWRLYRILEMP